MTDVVAAVGKADGATEVVDVLNFISPVRITDDPPFRRYVGSPSRGIDLLFDNSRVISVQIYVQGSGTFSAYSDELPFGLQGAKSQADVHHALGTPTESSNISSKYVFHERGVKVVTTYDGSMNMRLLSISPLDS